MYTSILSEMSSTRRCRFLRLLWAWEFRTIERAYGARGNLLKRHRDLNVLESLKLFIHVLFVGVEFTGKEAACRLQRTFRKMGVCRTLLSRHHAISVSNFTRCTSLFGRWFGYGKKKNWRIPSIPPGTVERSIFIDRQNTAIDWTRATTANRRKVFFPLTISVQFFEKFKETSIEILMSKFLEIWFTRPKINSDYGDIVVNFFCAQKVYISLIPKERVKTY